MRGAGSCWGRSRSSRPRWPRSRSPCGARTCWRRGAPNGDLKEILVPLVPAGLLVCLLVVLQPNLSTTIALGIILAALLWFGGLPIRLFVAIIGVRHRRGGVLALSAGYRSNRMQAFFNPGDDPQGIGYQARQAMYSLADGGMLGRGLGQSRAKWSYLPNSHNDFIFAIIGEELGFVGCTVVIGLFALFVYTGLRIATRSVDPFLRLLTADRHRLDSRAGVDQHRLRGRVASGDRSAATVGVGGWFVVGDHPAHVRHHRERRPARAGGDRGAARRAGRSVQPDAAAAQAGCVYAPAARA